MFNIVNISTFPCNNNITQFLKPHEVCSVGVGSSIGCGHRPTDGSAHSQGHLVADHAVRWTCPSLFRRKRIRTAGCMHPPPQNLGRASHVGEEARGAATTPNSLPDNVWALTRHKQAISGLDINNCEGADSQTVPTHHRQGSPIAHITNGSSSSAWLWNWLAKWMDWPITRGFTLLSWFLLLADMSTQLSQQCTTVPQRNFYVSRGRVPE